MINYALMGDIGASVTLPQPVLHRPVYGALARPLHQTCVTFLPSAAIERDVPGKLGLQRRIEAVQNCRTVQKANMLYNDCLPCIEVDPETHKVMVDGEHAFVEPAQELPLSRLYYLG